MHVLHLSATGAIGGAERSLLDILASVQQTTPDWRFAVVTGADGTWWPGAEARARDGDPWRQLARLGESGSSGARHGGTGWTAREARGQRFNTSSSCAVSSRSWART
jgi:hypothetical protein